ncbi:ABC transporter ATP-binding protein [Clostridiaceae bacterium HSG29]|nr:ABC transporter ATP-binding protein [Clostridiaceae bacterium HSG29]
MDNVNTVLDVKNLKVALKFGEIFKDVVRGIDFSLKEGEILGILGESGSGKSVTVKSLLGLMPEAIIQREGEAIFEDHDLLLMSSKKLKKIRGKSIGFVFQNSNSSMNHFMSINGHFKEMYSVHQLPYKKENVLNLLKEVGIKDPEVLIQMYPHQLSGGLSQRVGIALALCHNPKIIIADEPTSSIDASLRTKILELFSQINKKHGTAIILITHDFKVAQKYCDNVAIMYGGIFFEYGETQLVFNKPITPYTASLKKCAESLYNSDKVLYQLEGYSPSPLNFEDNCPFAERCDARVTKCNERMPQKTLSENRIFRCWNPLDIVKRACNDEN